VIEESAKEIPESDTLKKGQKEVPVVKKARSIKKKPMRKLAIPNEEDSEATEEDEPHMFKRLRKDTYVKDSNTEEVIIESTPGDANMT
ncbi:hypothetical protein A2U01_0062549, partial [Trifolium medium]|nr:hypothetical protein [Trifolium medium]